MPVRRRHRHRPATATATVTAPPSSPPRHRRRAAAGRPGHDRRSNSTVRTCRWTRTWSSPSASRAVLPRTWRAPTPCESDRPSPMASHQNTLACQGPSPSWPRTDPPRHRPDREGPGPTRCAQDRPPAGHLGGTRRRHQGCLTTRLGDFVKRLKSSGWSARSAGCPVAARVGQHGPVTGNRYSWWSGVDRLSVVRALIQPARAHRAMTLTGG